MSSRERHGRYLPEQRNQKKNHQGRIEKFQARETITAGNKNTGNVSPSPIKKNGFWTRNRIIAAVGLSAGLAMTAAYANRDPQSVSSSQTADRAAESKDTADLNEISLGNVRFFFQAPESIQPEKKKNIISKIRSAYGRLTQAFGAESMTMPQHYDFPIVIGDQIEKGMVSWKIQAKIDANGLPEVTNVPEPDALLVNDVSEDVLAHEFVHLYLQPSGHFWTEAFFEGHAYAIQSLLYPSSEDQSAGSVNQMLKIPAVREELEMGLDYNHYDQKILKGGIQDPLLNRLALAQWEKQWEEFAKSNPDFLKSFYAEIGRQKKQGKVSFQKNELIEIAKKVNPHFAEWYDKNALSMHDIGTTRKSRAARVIKNTASNLLCVFNFRTVPREVSGSNMVPPHLQPLYGGQIQVRFANPSTGKKQTENIPGTYGGFVGVIQLPEVILNDPSLEVNAGGTVIP